MDVEPFQNTENFLVSFVSFQRKIKESIQSLISNDEYLNAGTCAEAVITKSGEPSPMTVRRNLVSNLNLLNFKDLCLLIYRGGETHPVILSSDARVHDLFSAVERTISDKLLFEENEHNQFVSETSSRGKSKIRKAFSISPKQKGLNWRRFWRTHCLASNQSILENRSHLLKNIPGLSTGALLRFVRRCKKM